jgi:hypothetical protein
VTYNVLSAALAGAPARQHNIQPITRRRAPITHLQRRLELPIGRLADVRRDSRSVP